MLPTFFEFLLTYPEKCILYTKCGWGQFMMEDSAVFLAVEHGVRGVGLWTFIDMPEKMYIIKFPANVK